MAKIWHVTLESVGRQRLHETEDSLRAAVRAFARVAGGETLLFCIVDEHVHVVARCDRERAGRLARAVSLALKPTADVGFRKQAYIGPVEERRHMQRLVTYVLEQPSHHELPVHPALWTGSCFQDLVGARCVGALGAPLTGPLPRFKLAEVLPSVGLGAAVIVPADDERLHEAGAQRLAQAAAAALSVNPALTGNRQEVVCARAAAAVLARCAGISTSSVADALGASLRCVQNLSHVEPDSRVFEAVRTRLALEDVVAALEATGRQTAGPTPGPFRAGTVSRQ